MKVNSMKLVKKSLYWQILILIFVSNTLIAQNENQTGNDKVKVELSGELKSGIKSHLLSMDLKPQKLIN